MNHKINLIPRTVTVIDICLNKRWILGSEIMRLKDRLRYKMFIVYNDITV